MSLQLHKQILIFWSHLSVKFEVPENLKWARFGKGKSEGVPVPQYVCSSSLTAVKELPEAPICLLIRNSIEKIM